MNKTEGYGTERGVLSLLGETSLHAGTGSQVGAVDLPIQRERHTEWPTIYGSGIKGVFLDLARTVWDDELTKLVFGTERYAGALAFSDAKLLLFPVRTVGHPFAWVTCPLALVRFRRDAARAGLSDLPEISEVPSEEKVCLAADWPGGAKEILIDEFAFEAVRTEGLTELARWLAAAMLPSGEAYAYWRDLLQKALVLVTDDDFHDLVTHGTEIVTRVRIREDTKTVDRGALWTEENLPADCLLYSLLVAWKPSRSQNGPLRSAKEVIARFRELAAETRVIQVGGDETVGRGFVAIRLAGGDDA